MGGADSKISRRELKCTGVHAGPEQSQWGKELGKTCSFNPLHLKQGANIITQCGCPSARHLYWCTSEWPSESFLQNSVLFYFSSSIFWDMRSNAIKKIKRGFQVSSPHCSKMVASNPQNCDKCSWVPWTEIQPPGIPWLGWCPLHAKRAQFLSYGM